MHALAAPEIARIRDHCEPRAILFTTGASPDAARHAEGAEAKAMADPSIGAFAIAGNRPATPNRSRARARRRSPR